ncbi:MAG: hypothetical protein IJQ82_03410 [Selenomonadaceae bacterium]|nr:hypothetical protein [Selenomonadaceae bacterium]
MTRLLSPCNVVPDTAYSDPSKLEINTEPVEKNNATIGFNLPVQQLEELARTDSIKL